MQRFDNTQRRVIAGMAAGAAATIGGIGGALVAGHDGLLVNVGPYSRIAFWTGFSVPVTMTLMAFVGDLARHRFFTPHDIDGGNDSPGARARQAVLQNTLEQVVIWSLLSLAWTVRMPVWTLAVIPVSSLLFVAGRYLFSRGYRRGAGGRALGFALTFYPSVLMAVLLLIEVSGLAFQE